MTLYSTNGDWNTIALHANGAYMGVQPTVGQELKGLLLNPLTIGFVAVGGGTSGYQYYKKFNSAKMMDPSSPFKTMGEHNIFGKDFRNYLYSDKKGIGKSARKATFQPHIQWNKFGQIDSHIRENLHFDEKGNVKSGDKAAKDAYRKEHKLKKELYKNANEKLKAIKEGVKNGTLKGAALRTKLKELELLIDKADLKVLEEIKAGNIKPKGFFGKLSQYSGYNKIKRGILKLSTKGVEVGKNGKLIADAGKSAKAARVVGKGLKGFVKGGGAATAAIELACDAPEIYNTYKELGGKAGTKQLGKSAVKATAAGVGWWAGAKAGAAIGGAIGSCFPGAGNAIGAAVGGIIGGLVGCFGASKLAEKAVGKSELQKAKEKKAREDALAAQKGDKATQERLLVDSKGLAETEGADQRVIEALERQLAERENSLAQSEIVEAPEQDLQQADNSGGGYVSDGYEKEFQILNSLSYKA